MQKFFTIGRIATPAAVLAGLTMAALLMRPSFAAPVFPDPSSARSDIASFRSSLPRGGRASGSMMPNVMFDGS